MGHRVEGVRSSEELQSSESYINEQISKGATVSASGLSSYTADHWPVTRIGKDFVAFRTDDDKETVLPRNKGVEFTITRSPNHR